MSVFQFAETVEPGAWDDEKQKLELEVRLSCYAYIYIYDLTLHVGVDEDIGPCTRESP